MSTLTFEKSSPESVGIPADAVIQFTKRLAARASHAQPASNAP